MTATTTSIIHKTTMVTIHSVSTFRMNLHIYLTLTQLCNRSLQLRLQLKEVMLQTLCQILRIIVKPRK